MQKGTKPDYVGLAWKWLANQLGAQMTDQWLPKLADDPKDPFAIVSGSITDKTGENRTFSVLIGRDGVVNAERSYVSPKQLITR
jgi:hypothetical protein